MSSASSTWQPELVLVNAEENRHEDFQALIAAGLIVFGELSAQLSRRPSDRSSGSGRRSTPPRPPPPWRREIAAARTRGAAASACASSARSGASRGCRSTATPTPTTCCARAAQTTSAPTGPERYPVVDLRQPSRGPIPRSSCCRTSPIRSPSGTAPRSAKLSGTAAWRGRTGPAGRRQGAVLVRPTHRAGAARVPAVARHSVTLQACAGRMRLTCSTAEGSSP